MKRSNISILFYLKPTAKDQSLASIFARITVDQARKAFSINRVINKHDWDSSKQRASLKCKETIIINNQLQSIRQIVFEAHRIISDQGVYATVEMVYQKIIEKDNKNLCFINFYSNFLEKKEKLIGVETTDEIYKKHCRLHKKFIDFIYLKFKLSTFEFKKFNGDLGKDFFYYLKSNCKLSHNTAVKQMQLFKCVIKSALNTGHFAFDPFYEVKYKLKDNPRPYLDDEELKRVADLKNLLPRVELVRDIFIFSCYTGLAYIDVKQLQFKDIGSGINGKKWLFTKRQKTDVCSNIPLLPAAQDVINKYLDTINLRGNRLLPILSNQKMNAYLKELADLGNINKNLTFHVARHTFATTVTLSNGVSIESVSKMLGHKLMRTTQHYAKIMDRRVSEDMTNLENKLIKLNCEL